MVMSTKCNLLLLRRNVSRPTRRIRDFRTKGKRRVTDLIEGGEDMVSSVTTPRESAVFESVFGRMLAFVALPMPPRVEHNKDKYEETQHQQYDYAGIIFPDLFNAARELRPIHVGAKYTAVVQK